MLTRGIMHGLAMTMMAGMHGLAVATVTPTLGSMQGMAMITVNSNLITRSMCINNAAA